MVTHPKSQVGLYMEDKLGPPNLVRPTRNAVFDSPIPLIELVIFNLMKTWTTLHFYSETHQLNGSFNPRLHKITQLGA